MNNIYKRFGNNDKKIKLTQESFRNSNRRWLSGGINDIDNVVSVDIKEEVTESPAASVPVEKKSIEISLFPSGNGAVDVGTDLFSFVDTNLSLKYINVRALKIKPDMIKNLDNNYSGKLTMIIPETDEVEPMEDERDFKGEIPAIDIPGVVTENKNMNFPPLGSIVSEKPKQEEVVIPEFKEEEKPVVDKEPLEVKEEKEVSVGMKEDLVVEEDIKEEPLSRDSLDGRIFATEKVEESVSKPEEKDIFEEPKEEKVEPISVARVETKDDGEVADYLDSLRKLRNEADSLKAKAQETSESAERVKEDAKIKAETIKSLVEKETEKLKKEMEEAQHIIDKNKEEIAKSEEEIERYNKTQNELESLLKTSA